ncbi:molecular chaperone [Affinibrenneria salicis]|uniref:Molecular chaperone n=1 Tax=Affinibrenneria salicis TaxID=2590031 RepID=A0A5J5FUB2_9GAMM|nr:molecular chaperone [Affinibrenneria salicis]KAA8996952.1 molecular chaperone [Affinibrenneria salicis]
MLPSPLRSFFRILPLLLAGLHLPAFAGGSLLVWPIYQVIEADEKGSALWLENRGAQPIPVQIRIFAWKQIDFQDRYAEQDDVVASPPFATLEPGKRHLVRLMRAGQAASAPESAYRIIIDEIPPAPDSQSSKNAGVGLQFQMRYLLPLFLDGSGVWTKNRPEKKHDETPPAQPSLSWRLVAADGKTWLQIRNNGVVHARLSNVFWSVDGARPTKQQEMSPGFLGYVLAGQEMRWPLPRGTQPPAPSLQLYARMADNSPLVMIKHQ